MCLMFGRKKNTQPAIFRSTRQKRVKKMTRHITIQRNRRRASGFKPTKKRASVNYRKSRRPFAVWPSRRVRPVSLLNKVPVTERTFIVTRKKRWGSRKGKAPPRWRAGSRSSVKNPATKKERNRFPDGLNKNLPSWFLVLGA